MNKSLHAADTIARQQRSDMSYQAALRQHSISQGLARVCWATWFITIGTVLFWCFTVYQEAIAVGAHTLHDIFMYSVSNAINVQPQDDQTLTHVLVTYGAKDNSLILHGQYWRFITPIFLHVNALHVGLNMLNFFILGLFLERIVGTLRFLLIYLITGVISVIASFYFAPQDISVGASGAIFGIVGAYSLFVLVHRRAFPHGGIPAMLWLVVVVGINLSIGLLIPNVDNYAHVGGLLSGCLLGWWFTPLYKVSSTEQYTDIHRLSRRWPLVVLTILGTLVIASIAIHFAGPSSP